MPSANSNEKWKCFPGELKPWIEERCRYQFIKKCVFVCVDFGIAVTKHNIDKAVQMQTLTYFMYLHALTLFDTTYWKYEDNLHITPNTQVDSTNW